MARNNKVGLDYFSHDTDMSNDIKLKFIKAKYGLIGYAVYNKLLEEIYKDKGYFLEINDRYIILFSDENKLEVNVCINIINDCINEGLFSHLLHSKYKILTSRRIQENYIKGCERRKTIEFQKKYLLLDPHKVLPENNNVNINIINGNIKPIKCKRDVDINLQSKEEESKEEERIENETETKTESKTLDSDFEKFWNLYDKKVGDKNKVIKKFSQLKDEDKNKIFETLPDYIISTPDKKFRKNPETYLNNHSWNDEIIKFNQNGTVKPRRNTLQDF